MGTLWPWLLWLLPGYAAALQIGFEEVTQEVGIHYVGPSWAAAWRDFDDDGRVDLWLSNHGGLPSLLVNGDDGRFRDGNARIGNLQARDGHAAAWADFDNDGDPDLLEIVGAALGMGQGGNRLFVNEDGMFREAAASLGLAYPLGRGRVPLWLDYDLDGDLDVLIMNQSRRDRRAPSALFRNDGDGFTPQTAAAGLVIGKTANDAFAMIADVRGSPAMELLLFGSGPPHYAPRAFAIENGRFQEISRHIFPDRIRDVFDAVSADLNGDAKTDLYLARYRYASSIVAMNERDYRVGIFNTGAQVRGVDFRSSGELRISVHLPTIKWDFSRVLLGRNAVPAKPRNRHLLSGDLALSPLSDEVIGDPGPITAGDKVIHIWYQPDDGRWYLRFSSETWAFLQLQIHASRGLGSVRPYGFEPSPMLQPRLLLSGADGYRVGKFPRTPSCPSVAVADFDNDMDLDLYLVCTESVANLPNRLYENDGKGNFREVPSHGAQGSTQGIGHKAVVADYDNDGFQDLLLINGLGVVSPISQGPYQLFRNLGNDNHWLKIRLQGRQSNRDAVGALVLLEAGGVSQRREQNGGNHYGAQDDILLHFGLGENTRVDRVRVIWPNGRVQELSGISADQTLVIVEPSS